MIDHQLYSNVGECLSTNCCRSRLQGFVLLPRVIDPAIIGVPFRKWTNKWDRLTNRPRKIGWKTLFFMVFWCAIPHIFGGEIFPCVAPIPIFLWHPVSLSIQEQGAILWSTVFLWNPSPKTSSLCRSLDVLLPLVDEKLTPKWTTKIYNHGEWW